MHDLNDIGESLQGAEAADILEAVFEGKPIII